MMEYKIYGEAAYLDLARRILKDGKYRQEGDEFGRYELFAQPLKFDLLGNKLPLLTTKRVFFRGLAHEMLWFISGKTKIDYLKDNDVKIWDIWADENNDVGPLYGYQWRHWRVDPKMRPYVGSDEVDQLSKVMKSLRDRPEARSHVISAWRPDHGPAMSIKPCHILLQFYRIPLSWDERVRYYADVIKGMWGAELTELYESGGDDQDHEYLDRNGVPRDGLSLSLTQRSCDFFLGVPFNIGQYALLCHMVAHQLGCAPLEFTHLLNDVHIYENSIEAINTQIEREPRPEPQLFFERKPNSIEEYRYEDFNLVNYNPHPKLPKVQVSEQGTPGGGMDMSKLEETGPFGDGL